MPWRFNAACGCCRCRPRATLAQFGQELLTLLNAGLALVESIETLCEKESHAERRALLEKLVDHLFQGSSLSSALAQFPTVFPPLFVATVRASERTGGLPEALEKYVAYQGQLDGVKKKVISASAGCRGAGTRLAPSRRAIFKRTVVARHRAMPASI